MAHTSQEQLQQKLEDAKKNVVVGGKYHHWKDPSTIYTVLSVGFTEWNEEIVVVYQADISGVTWVRRLEGEDGWLTEVSNDIDDKRRFIHIT